MSSNLGSALSLKFPLDVVDGWPPVAVESLPFSVLSEGYQALAAPLFVKDLSVGDVITPRFGDANTVDEWSHLSRSARTTIWLLRLKQSSGIDAALTELRALGCNTVGSAGGGCYSIDVPEAVSLESVDAVLAALDGDAVAVSFPSLRHSDVP